MNASKIFHFLSSGSSPYEILFDSFEERVLADSGTAEGETCAVDRIEYLSGLGFYDSASLILTPSGYKAGKLYALKPTDGSGDFAFTRNATSNRKQSSGMGSIAIDVPKIDYAGSECPYFLHQTARTNLLLRSEEFDNASWTKTNVTASADAIASPNVANTTADKIVETTANSTHVVTQTITKAASAISYTLSVFAKKGERDFIRLRGDDGTSSNSIETYFDLTNGLVRSTIDTGTFTYVSSRIESYDNDWYRCILTLTTNTTTSLRFFTYIQTADRQTTYAGDDTKGLYLFGPQVEAGLNVTPYIVTGAATASSTADALTALTGIEDLIGQTEGTFYFEAQAWADGTTKAITLSDGTTNNRVLIQFSSGNLINTTIVAGGVVQATISSAAFPSGVLHRIAVVYRSGYAALFVNGVKIGEDLSVTVPAMTQLAMGTGAGSLPFYGKIKIIGISKTASSDANCLLLTRENPNEVDNTKIYNVYNTLNETGIYYFGQGLAQNPNDENTVVRVAHHGEEHTWALGKKSVSWTSIDKGKTFGSAVDVWSDAEYSVQGGEFGYDSNVRIHGFMDAHDELEVGSNHKLIYAYSDDDGATWTTAERPDLIPDDGNLTFRAHGTIFQAGNYLVGSLFTIAEEGDFSASSRYILRMDISTGIWETILVGTNPGGTLISESHGTYLGNGYIVLISRNETTKGSNQDISADFGATWTDQGDITFGLSLTTAGPAIITSFMEGEHKVCVAYLPDRSASPLSVRLKCVYGLATDIIANGKAGWNTDTMTDISLLSETGNLIQTYGAVLHYNNNFNAIASMPFEENPFSEFDNNLILFDIPSTHYGGVKRALGI